MGQWSGTSGSLAAMCHWLLVERKQLLKEIETMGDDLQDANARLREAVEARLSAGGAAAAACCEGGRCHPVAVDTRGPIPDVDQVVADDDEQTPESPWLSAGYGGKGQIEEAWASVKARYEETQRRIKGDGHVERRVFSSEPPRGSECEAERLLLDAAQTVRDRRAKYGPPLEHFRRTVGAINAIFAHKLREPLTPEDWAQIMMLDKLARHQEKPQRDNPLDGCGYAACWAETMTEGVQ